MLNNNQHCTDTNKRMPKLSHKRQKFVREFVNNGENATEAYRNSYDVANMKQSSIWVEASRLLKDPKVTLWIEHYKQSVQKVDEDEIKYSHLQAFHEADNLLNIALSEGKGGIPNMAAAAKLLEMKNRLAGNFDKDNEQKNNENTIINVIRPEISADAAG